jgi:MtrB/PioB family decaheme-associated outer membrane protein
MKVRIEVLKTRAAILLTGAMAIVAGSSSGVWAADAIPFLKAPPPEQGWYFNGEVEAGGRAFIQRPPSGFGYNASGNFLLPTQTDSRAKFEEYGKVPEGLFLDWFYLAAGSKDGRFNFDVWGKDVGVNAQSYNFDFSQNGFQYLTLGWDQTPHLYSTSAKSLFGGVGTTTLTVPDAVQNALQPLWAAASANTPAGLAARQAINNIIEGNATSINEIGTRRDTFSAEYRITPTDAWDFRVGYAHQDRTGTKPGTLDYTYQPPTGGFPSNVIAVPVPVDDTTHKPHASGEYAGTSPWGRYSVEVAYNGSVYTDNITQLTAENPFSNTGAQLNFGSLLMPLPPSNQAHFGTISGATDVPLFKSRFTSINQWGRMTQNASFLDTAANGITADPLPAASLNGEVNTFLTNNVLTSKFDKDLWNKMRFRYYDRDNTTTPIQFGQIALANSEAQVPGLPEYESYKKTNFDEELKWNTPVKWLTVGAGYGFERWDRTNRFTTITDEHTGNFFADARPNDTMVWHASYSYSARRYSGEYAIDDGAWLNSRMFDLADRNRQRARISLDYDVNDFVTISPSAGLRWDDYPETTPFQTGLSSEHVWNAGIQVGVRPTSALRLMAGYTYEQSKLDMSAVVPDAAGTAPGNVCNFPGYAFTTPYTAPPQCGWSDNLTTTYHTFITSADWKAIPGKLDFRANYVASWSREAHDFTPCSANLVNCNGVVNAGVTPAQAGLPWPDNTNLYQRFDLTGRYYFDKDYVERLGWKGQVILKLRYTLERNDGSYWQSDAVNAYFGTLTGNTELTGTSRSLWLAYNNPNYTAQLLAATVKFKW